MECNRSISNCPQSGGGEDFFHASCGCNFKKKSETKITKGHCAIFMYYQKKKKGNKNAELPLCSLNLISLWGMCSGKRQSLFNFQFCLPLLSSADPRLGLLGTENCVSKAEPASGCQTRLVQSLVQERWIHFRFFCLFVVCFSCGMHTVRQRRRQLLHAVTSHTQTHATPRGRTRRFGRKHKQ